MDDTSIVQQWNIFLEVYWLREQEEEVISHTG